MSDIRVSVRWKSSAVFAGEEVECTVTFKNVTPTSSLRRSPSPHTSLRSHGSSRERWKETLPSRLVQGAAIQGKTYPPSTPGFPHSNIRSQKPPLSLKPSHGLPLPRKPNTPRDSSRPPELERNTHRRSVSIISIGGDTISEASSPGPILKPGRPARGHARAASLQVNARKLGSFNGGSSSVSGQDRAFTVPSPLYRSSSSVFDQRRGSQAMPRLDLGKGLSIPSPSKQKRNFFPSFTFPEEPNSEEAAEGLGPFGPGRTSETSKAIISPRSLGSASGLEQLKPATRILSAASINGTPRSSGEFYSVSNNSTETLASECITHDNSRLVHRTTHKRQDPLLAPPKNVVPEVLMMGYAQVTGSFTVDGSLVNQTSFEETRKRGVVGGRAGGGVVRNESAKRDSGLLGSFGWANIGESLGGLLGGNEFSSLKEENDNAKARSIPILSTPQSILFVDLRLNPGESRSYSYRSLLPKGIPPSHKGRAIKIAYNVVVGTQRATKASQQLQVQQVTIPFRVMTSVNDRGEILGHGLMSPHINLSNTASTSRAVNPQAVAQHPREGVFMNNSKPSNPDFLSYVDNLLDMDRQLSGAGLDSPTERRSTFQTAVSEDSGTMKDVIDLAILRSNAATSFNRSANRFAIARGGERVAVIKLARPAYRLGETVPVVIDLEESDLQCYSLHAMLETFETIDPSLALRSKASVYRVTRRIHASQFECTVAARKILFNPMIPLISTPDFITSGINLEWNLRFEFVTNRIGNTEGRVQGIHGLMEDVAKDDRGTLTAAVQGLPCENFDVTVPLRVYGATTSFDEGTVSSEILI